MHKCIEKQEYTLFPKTTKYCRWRTPTAKQPHVVRDANLSQLNRFDQAHTLTLLFIAGYLNFQIHRCCSS